MNIADQALIEEVIGFAREKLKSSHTLDFTIVAIDERGPSEHFTQALPRQGHLQEYAISFRKSK